MAVPYTFATATSAIPLSQLDNNFATAITLGNTSIQLGNTVTTLNNMTLSNVTISSGTSNLQTNVANATGVLLETNGGTGTTTGYYGFKNRIINGAMVIDQRNSGASVAIGSGTYTVDRFYAIMQAGSGNTAQRSTTVPAGFINSTVITVGTGAAPTSTQAGLFFQAIEGLNVADLNWGSSSALTVTLSFWVRSSLTGTFGCGIKNGAGTRSYTASYTISSANTWQQVSVTIPGDTTGAWATDNSVGFLVGFDIGEGSTRSQTAGSWTSGNTIGLTGGTKLCATSGATFYITGVQLEKGSIATSFDYRPYGTELALCQRYYEKSYNNSVAVPTAVTAGTGQLFVNAIAGGATVIGVNFAVSKRTSPTVVAYDNAGTSGKNSYYTTGWNNGGTATINTALEKGFNATLGGTGTLLYLNADWAASAEL